jgi:hypothetical protein
MAQLGKAFDFSAVDTTDNFELLPAGDYIVEVVDSAIKQTRAGDGEYISLQLRVVDGQYENRRVYTNINTVSPKADTQAIGEKLLAQLCSAVGLPHALEDTADLHSIPVRATLKIEREKNGYPARNNVRAFKSAANAPAPVAAAPSVAAAKPANAAPWKR